MVECRFYDQIMLHNTPGESHQRRGWRSAATSCPPGRTPKPPNGTTPARSWTPNVPPGKQGTNLNNSELRSAG